MPWGTRGLIYACSQSCTTIDDTLVSCSSNIYNTWTSCPSSSKHLLSPDRQNYTVISADINTEIHTSHSKAVKIKAVFHFFTLKASLVSMNVSAQERFWDGLFMVIQVKYFPPSRALISTVFHKKQNKINSS